MQTDQDIKTEKSSDKITLNKKTMTEQGLAWENQNHSVVLVGWGYDEKTSTKYWIVRNSYGPNWGMEGDFLVRKG